MNYISSKEAAVKWNISERMVRKYCTQNRIKDAVLENGIWYIPEGTSKPKREDKKVAATPLHINCLQKGTQVCPEKSCH